MSDLIDRKAAIEWCLEGLSNMPSAQPEWIPVTERLPEEDKYVLVCYEPLEETSSCQMAVGWREADRMGRAQFHCWDDNCTKYGEVLAWMPLPEPYRGEDNETD